jgi:hypothetical protein
VHGAKQLGLFSIKLPASENEILPCSLSKPVDKLKVPEQWGIGSCSRIEVDKSRASGHSL